MFEGFTHRPHITISKIANGYLVSYRGAVEGYDARFAQSHDDVILAVQRLLDEVDALYKRS